MRTFVITSSCIALALVLASFAPLPWTATSTPGASVATLELTLAAGPLQTPEYVDAH